jgi:hypothetical protein
VSYNTKDAQTTINEPPPPYEQTVNDTNNVRAEEDIGFENVDILDLIFTYCILKNTQSRNILDLIQIAYIIAPLKRSTLRKVELRKQFF